MKWAEVAPDFTKKPADTLFRNLGLLPTLCIISKCMKGPTILIARNVWDGVKLHLQSRNVELGGLLIGNVYEGFWRKEHPLIVLNAYAESNDYEATSVSLQMSPDIWNKARQNFGEKGSVIGWYHSHPNLGAFFSGTDRRTQRAFFREAHSVALVLDPVREEQKWYLGQDSQELESTQVVVGL